MTRIVTLLSVLLMTAAPAAAPVFAETSPVPAVERSVGLPAITVATVEKRLLRDRIFASGLIGPVERVYVQPEIEGQAIAEILAEVGDTVSQGQVLARLSDTALGLQNSQLEASRASANAQIAQAEAQLVGAQASADEAERVRLRTQTLREQGTASQAQADQAMASATSAAAQVNVAVQTLSAARAQLALVDAQIADNDLKLARTQIKATVAGVVVDRNAQLGAIATAGSEPMFVIVRDGLLELRADVAEQDTLRLASGQKVLMRAVGLAEPLTGTVRLVEPEVDAATRLGQVRIALDALGNIRSGLFAEAEILVAESEGLSLPVTSVAMTDGETSVLRVGEGDVVERVAVTTGIRDGGNIEIISGLSEGDRIVARAGAFVRPGDQINPVAELDPAAQSN